MQYLAPTNIFEGVVQLNQAPTADSHAVTRAFMRGDVISAIHADSANYAEVAVVGGVKQLKIKPLTITDVQVDTTAATLAAWITANYTGSEKQEGDIIVLTGVSGRSETYIYNGGTAGTAADWAEIKGGDPQAAEVRGFFSASSGINYDSGTGAFTADSGEIRSLFQAGSGLSYNSGNGTFALNVDSDGISEGSSNLYFTDARARGAVSAGTGLSYNSGTGVFALNVDSDGISEGSSNLYFTDARARGAISLKSGAVLSYNSGTGQLDLQPSVVRSQVSAGAGLSYNSGTGAFALNVDTDGISEGSNNLYFTDARARGAVSAGTGLSYNSGSGQFALNVDTDGINEGSSNQYFTQARARASVSADGAATNLLEYNSGTGAILVSKSKFRAKFAPQNLTANTFATLNHGLGEKLVHVSGYDSSGNLVQLDVQLTDANNLKVKSVINQSNLEIIVSI